MKIDCMSHENWNVNLQVVGKRQIFLNVGDVFAFFLIELVSGLLICFKNSEPSFINGNGIVLTRSHLEYVVFVNKWNRGQNYNILAHLFFRVTPLCIKRWGIKHRPFHPFAYPFVCMLQNNTFTELVKFYKYAYYGSSEKALWGIVIFAVIRFVRVTLTAAKMQWPRQMVL